MSKFKPFGLRGSMVSILFIIGKRKGVNQKDIADTLVLDQSTVSRDLRALVKNGWIEINKAADPRQSNMELTNEGKKLLEEVSPIWHEMHTKVESILGSFNIQHIDNITNAIRHNMEEIT